MLRFVLGLLYFFKFQFAFLFIKSYVGWEVCALALHLHVFLFPLGSKLFEDGGGGGRTGLDPITCHGILCNYYIKKFFNPSLNPRRRQKINLHFFFTLHCGASKGFMKALKTFIKPFEAPQSVKIKI